MNLRCAILLLMLLAVPVLCWGQSPHPAELSHGLAAQSSVPVETSAPELTLADLEAMALANNPALAIAGARVEGARGEWVQAGLYPNPAAGYHATEIGRMGGAGLHGAFISQRFITGGKLRLDRDVAGQRIHQTNLQFDTQRQRVLNDVRIRFYEALIAQRRIDLTRELLRIGRESAEATQKLLEGRQVGKNDLLQAHIEADTAEIQYENTLNEHREAWRRLSAAVGLPVLSAAPVDGDVEGDLQAYSWETLLAGVLGGSPELAAAEAAVCVACARLQRASRQWIPDVDVWVSVRDDSFDGREVTNIQVGMPIPVFDRNQGNVYRAHADLIAARSRVEQIELDLQQRLATAFRRYENARVQAAKYKNRIVPNAREALELVTQAYNQGQLDYLTLLTTQRTYFEVSLAYLSALRELRTSQTVLEGQLVVGSLQ